MDFPGKLTLIAALDAAVTRPGPAGISTSVASVLRRLRAESEMQLPASVLTPVAGHYARRELHVSDALGYSVVAMTWAPGQGTPVHDHDGAWCAEVVWQGRLCVDDYAPRERAGGLWRFEHLSRAVIATGESGRLEPPDEYHAVHNPDPERVAVSIHVYQRQLLRCQVFVADPAAPPGWLRGEERLLASEPA